MGLRSCGLLRMREEASLAVKRPVYVGQRERQIGATAAVVKPGCYPLGFGAAEKVLGGDGPTLSL